VTMVTRLRSGFHPTTSKRLSQRMNRVIQTVSEKFRKDSLSSLEPQLVSSCNTFANYLQTVEMNALLLQVECKPQTARLLFFAAVSVFFQEYLVLST